MPKLSLRKQAAITADRVRELFSYDPDTGVLARKGCRRPLNPSPKTGYLYTNIDGFYCLAHRVAWLHFYGRWPTLALDHINGNRADNRIKNLREATALQNVSNRRPQGRRLLKGVTFANGGWQAQIRHNGKNLYLGRFKSAYEAAAVYAAKAKEIHGEFAFVASGGVCDEGSV